MEFVPPELREKTKYLFSCRVIINTIVKPNLEPELELPEPKPLEPEDKTDQNTETMEVDSKMDETENDDGDKFKIPKNDENSTRSAPMFARPFAARHYSAILWPAICGT